MLPYLTPYIANTCVNHHSQTREWWNINQEGFTHVMMLVHVFTMHTSDLKNTKFEINSSDIWKWSFLNEWINFLD